MPGELIGRCPSCGRELGEIVSTRYRGNLTVIRFRADPDDEDADTQEHVCGDTEVST